MVIVVNPWQARNAFATCAIILVNILVNVGSIRAPGANRLWRFGDIRVAVAVNPHGRREVFLPLAPAQNRPLQHPRLWL